MVTYERSASVGDVNVMTPGGKISASMRPAPSVKKISPGLRREKMTWRSEKNLFKRTAVRMKEDSQFLRSVVQGAFALLCIWIGIEFHLFMKWGMSNGQATAVGRPPGAEGFLPISALISLKYWIGSGIINTIHPASLFIFIAIVLVGVLFRKAFCSWLCPVGTLSESLWMLGQKIFGRNLHLPNWVDIPLRSLKYLLLAFFGWAVWHMDTRALAAFINSPYNKVADVKMYLFFAQVSGFALWAIVSLMALSVVIPNFWCRFLCPYGALLGLGAFFSPFRVHRNAENCIDCELCTKACPAAIKVHTVASVRSDECTNCLACVQACPLRDTLEVRVPVTHARVPGWALGMLIVGVFAGVTGLAMLSGHWQSSIPREEYRRRIQQIDSPIYQHFRGEVPAYGPND